MFSIDADGDIVVSQTTNAADHPECGSSQSPCKTLLYAAKRCDNQTCHYKIDGGFTEKPYEYIIDGGKFTTHAINFSMHGFGLHMPRITCNKQYNGTCIDVSGLYFSAGRFEVVGTPISFITLSSVYLGSGLKGATLSSAIFSNVRLFSTVSYVQNCSFSGSVTKLGAGDRVNVKGSYFFDTSISVGEVRR